MVLKDLQELPYEIPHARKFSILQSTQALCLDDAINLIRPFWWTIEDGHVICLLWQSARWLGKKTFVVWRWSPRFANCVWRWSAQFAGGGPHNLQVCLAVVRAICKCCLAVVRAIWNFCLAVARTFFRFENLLVWKPTSRKPLVWKLFWLPKTKKPICKEILASQG